MDNKIISFGKYKLLNQIARGGMAEIFLGCSGSIKSAHKFLVIKRILSVHSHNKEFNKMFQNEGKIVVNLNHSNIGSIYEFGVEKNQYFICMEYISGRNMRQLVKKLKSQKKTLNPAMCAHIIRYACNGLDYAHNCTDSITGQPFNIIHRDISPQNIMISFGGDVKVIDFGIAKVDDSEATKVGVLKGKFEYMSPEQVRGKTVDRRTDIFSLGSVLWELLANKKLFTGSNEVQILKKIKNCEIPNLKKINPNIPDRLVEIVNKALSSNKNLRYQTMAEMGKDISIFLNKVYPDFTHNTFSSFIKEVYIEEILEERQTLKKYSQLLASRAASGKRLSRQSSFSYEPSKFVGHNEELDKKQNKRNKEDDKYRNTVVATEKDTHTFADSFATRTQQDDYTRTAEDRTITNQEITKTRFEDSLSQGEVDTANKKYTIVSDGYRNTITDEDTSEGLDTLLHTASNAGKSAYEPWVKNKRKKLSTKVKKQRKKSFFRKAIMGLSVCGCIVAVYMYQKGIKTQIIGKMEKVNQNVFQKQTNGAKDLEEAQGSKPALESRSSKAAPASRGVNSVKKKKKRKNKVSANSFSRNIFVNTQPSGAQLYINGRKVDVTTPASVMVPANGNFELTIKRLGYHDKTVTLSTRDIKGIVNFPLKRKKSIKNNSPKVIIMK